MKDVMTAIAALQGEIRAVRAFPRASRMTQAKELVGKYWQPPVTPPTALALLLLMTDSAETAEDWQWIGDFIGKLPEDIAEQEEVRELNAFVLSNTGKPLEAIARIEALIQALGPTPDRLGLLGGRYKRLYAKAATPTERLMYLNKSIDCYERGMELDLNEYYCSSNLPRLYKVRKRKGDQERAQSASRIVIAACERAVRRGVADEWVRPTLLGTAFDNGDCDKAEELAGEVASEGAARWKLDSILLDLETSVSLIEDKDRKERLAAILEDLKQISAG